MMAWTLEVTIVLFGAILMLSSSIVLGIQYHRLRDQAILILFLGWFLYFIYWFNLAMGYLLRSTGIFKLNMIVIIIVMNMIILAMNEINRTTGQSIRSFLATLFSGMGLITIFEGPVVKNYTFDNGDLSYIFIGNYRNVIGIIGVFISIIYLEYTINLLIEVPEHLKKYALLNFFGSVIFGPISMFIFITEIGLNIPGIIPLITGIGVLITSIAISQSPQLIYILPFKADFLSIIDIEKGVTVYSYNWTESDSSPPVDLFSSAFTGLSIFADEAVDRGQMKEIVFDEGILLINDFPSHNLGFVILTSKVVPIIREGLQQFADDFVDSYATQIDDMKASTTLEKSKFKDVISLIDEHFPFIPRY